MHPRLWNRGTTRQFLRLALVGLLAGGLGWTGLAPAPAISGPPPPPAVGWVVGVSSDGYGVILHPTDGGAQWQRQGTSGEIPDVGLNGVSAVDQDYAWASGGKADGYGVILHTTDGGAQWQRQPTGADGYELLRLSALDGQTAWAVGGQIAPDEPPGIILFKQEGQDWTSQAYDPAVQLVDVSFPQTQRERSLPAAYELLMQDGLTPAK